MPTLEMLVLGLCIAGANCNKATQAYSALHPEIQHNLSQDATEMQNYLTNLVGKDTVVGIGIVGAALFEKDIKVKLNHNFYVERNSKGDTINYIYTF